MASQKILSLSRLLTSTATTTVLRRSFSTTTSSSSNLRFSLLRTISAVTLPSRTVSLPSSSSRCFSSQSPQRYNDNNASGSNRPPKETILLEGCDFEHWLVVLDPPPEDFTRDMIIDYYIKTLAPLFDGSEDEARRKIYSVSTKHYFAFGALISEELSIKLKEFEKVRWVLPDSYLDVKNKDYGGEPFIDGQAVPYDPKYHEEWVRNNQKAHERNNRGDNRPRNNDRSRNFERRQRTPEGNMGGAPPNQHGGPTRYPGPNQNAPNMAPRNAPYQQNMPPANPGYQQNMPPANPGYQQNMPPANPGFQQNMPPANPGYQQNMPPNNHGYQQNMPPNNAGGYQQNNATGYQQNMPPNNAGYQQNMPPPPPPPNNMSGNYGGHGNNPAPNYQAGGGMPYQNNAPVGGQQNFAPNGGQNIPGRDLPQ